MTAKRDKNCKFARVYAVIGLSRHPSPTQSPQTGHLTQPNYPTMKRHFLLLPLVALSLISCYEDGYDLRDVDLTLQLGSDTLWTPYNSSGDILLKDFIYETSTVHYMQRPDSTRFFAIRTGEGTLSLKAQPLPGTQGLELLSPVARSVELGAMPDFLNEGDVVLDLQNPIVDFSVRNEAPAALSARFALTAYDDAGRPLYTCRTDPFSLPAASTSSYYLAQSVPAAWDYFTQGRTYVRAEGLRQLVRKVPRYVEMTLLEAACATAGSLPAQLFGLDFRFRLFVPFEAGQDFRLVARDSTKALTFDLADYARLNTGEVVVQGLVDNDVSLRASVSANLMDAGGQTLDGLTLTAASVPPLARNYPVTLHLQAQGGHRLSDFMDGSHGARRFDHLQAEARLTSDGTSAPLITLGSRVRLHHVRIGLVGGITIDGNKR